MRRSFSIIILFIVVSAIIVVAIASMNKNQKTISTERYVALGDSYTIGEGASEQEAWPTLLTKNLNKNNVAITLVANPSITGWTTQQVIENELPILEASDPTFVTLLIGVNDWVQGVDKKKFQSNLITILDRVQAKLPDKSKIVLVTIPDFSATPNGKLYGNDRDISAGIAEFNAIIASEGAKRNLPVVDIYPMSKDMAKNPNLVATDGLHPSAEEYALWETLIYPEAYKLLTK